MASNPITRRICLTVDLDPLSAYHRIHGLAPPAPLTAERLVQIGWTRFLDLAESLRVQATFFVVGKTLDADVYRTAERALRLGHELANHTWNHSYDFLSMNSEEMEKEIARCEDSLKNLTGKKPAGFRSPGYGASRNLFKILRSRGYRYDSSLLPSLPYYLAKSAVMLSMKARGQTSGAKWHNPRTVTGPLQPYRISPVHPFRPSLDPHSRLWEMPVAVAPIIRIPIIGTSVALATPPFSWILARFASMSRVIVFECHAIDLVDEKEFSGELSKKQPDLRIPWILKRNRIADFLSKLSKTHDFGTLEGIVPEEVP